MFRQFARAGIVALATALTTVASYAQDAAPFSLDGRIIRFVHGQATGGTADTEMRLLVDHLAPYLPGNPGLVMQSLNGANGILPRRADDVAALVDALYSKPDAVIDVIRTYLAVE